MRSTTLDQLITKAGQIKRSARELSGDRAAVQVADLAEAVEDLATMVKELKRTVDRPKREV